MIHRFATMTWQEIHNAAEAGATALLPVASLEQHGHYLPAETDTALVGGVAEAASNAVSERGARVVLAPTLWLGASNHHAGYFAMSVSETTYIDVIVEMVGGIARAGFQRVFLLNGHGGNSAPLRVALNRLRDAAPTALVAAADYWRLASSALSRIRESAPGGMAHAGEAETSLMLHLHPDEVRLPPDGSAYQPDRKALPEQFVVDLLSGGPVATSLSWEELSGTGAIGDPQLASAEKGAAMFDAAVRATADTLVAFSRMRRGA
jgi:creatinine amidohydrolase